jgi:prophage regulatory protein
LPFVAKNKNSNFIKPASVLGFPLPPVATLLPRCWCKNSQDTRQ